MEHKARYDLVRRLAEIFLVPGEKSFVKPNAAFQSNGLLAGLPDGFGVRINTDITNSRAFCMKCDGETCWVAPSSPRCWAVQSSDTVPLLCATGLPPLVLAIASPFGDAYAYARYLMPAAATGVVLLVLGFTRLGARIEARFAFVPAMLPGALAAGLLFVAMSAL